MRILIVEDDPVSRTVLRRVLCSLEEVEIFEAHDGEQAWEMIQDGLQPDLCFLDINMPRKNGLQLLGLIRKEPKHAAMRVCICSAVRAREVVVEAANLRPDFYLLKPYSKADIVDQVKRARSVVAIAAPEEICRKTGLSRAEYVAELETMMAELRSLPQRSTNSMLTHNYLDELITLEHIISVAKRFGAARILELSVRMATVTKEARELPKGSGQRSYSEMLQILQEIQNEAAQLEQHVARIAADIAREKNDQSRADQESSALAQFVLKVFQNGRILAPSPASQSKTLSIPIRATKLGASSTTTAGAITRKQAFTLSILDDRTLAAIEDCRKIGSLTRLLSFRLGEKMSWVSEAAIRLLESEVAAKNAQGVLLLRSVVGDDLAAFLESKRGTIQESLAQAGARMDDAGIQQILRDLRERFERVLGGQLTAQPVFSPLSIGDLQGGDDEPWAMPYALLWQSALLFRTAVADPEFNRDLKFNTFDREMFLESMNVIGDRMAAMPDTQQAIAEIKKIEAIKRAKTTYREKCGKLLALIRGRKGKPGENLTAQAETLGSEEMLDDAVEADEAEADGPMPGIAA